MSDYTAGLHITVEPGDTYVAEPGEIDATGRDFGVLVTGQGPATVTLDGVVCRGSRNGLGIQVEGGAHVSGGKFHCGSGYGMRHL